MKNKTTVAEAHNIIKQAMIDDEPGVPGSFAHSWHCNIAMMCYDAMHEDDGNHRGDETKHQWRHRVVNDAASRFMKLCFDVETKA